MALYDDAARDIQAQASALANLQPGQLDCGLTGRIRGTNDVDHIALALVRLSDGGAVINPAAGQLLESTCLEPPVGHTGRDHERATFDLPAIGEECGAYRPPGLEADHVTCQTISAPNRDTCAMAR